MQIKIKDQPFYMQATVILFGLILTVYTFSILADIFIPIAFAGFLARR